MKNIAIIGASGSIGTQTLEVLRSENELLLTGVSVHSNLEKLKEIIMEFNPRAVAVTDERKYKEAIELTQALRFEGELSFGTEGLIRIATLPEVDTVVTSLVGMVGLKPTVEAIKAGKNIALANKETLVAAGEIVMQLAREHQVKILPVDSEHSAIFQSLQGSSKEEVSKIILTASGGPFRGKDRSFLQTVTKEMALKHPNWVMGAKITIDSSTMMNKGLEVIEARWLFDVNYDNIEVYVHPESIVHSMVQFCDNSVIAQLGAPDMRLPIQYALNYPNRHEAVADELNLLEIQSLHFMSPDKETFRALELAYIAGRRGGLQTAVMNSANEEAVELFLKDKIRYFEIAEVVEEAMERYRNLGEISLDKVLETDIEVREYVRRKFKEV
ncbi:1-deoxy-D-xylulose-5-phosphate reductoisomerase [Proteiniclasticum sp. SCR006]|uniref:1-deoxy-D-xylulose 5-phosphate reductoisomerase n=1 Tax=Proteiniclasticum aestuarii TaxID=2817862 RepID=A0A939H3X9_9CLOT|nr:1-deoxy-D-xylulose-5-phosphate reductoisomerase [Proteiniclasticum aestuarii]MBO1263679.1 1-deoxy-D-xylulose-5-phosphate reductoisomerase [Proteiniclasticum aestuarii]